LSSSTNGGDRGGGESRVGAPEAAATAGWDVIVRWEDVLSLGEQQRIGMARLFYHKPNFAVLDECTSAVSVDVEERLYREADRLGICCITLSQRLALTEFHANELKLGVPASKSLWELHSL
jgi:ABC-type uncharacterized transport system fused permease/ATPase subunit